MLQSAKDPCLRIRCMPSRRYSMRAVCSTHTTGLRAHSLFAVIRGVRCSTRRWCPPPLAPVLQDRRSISLPLLEREGTTRKLATLHLYPATETCMGQRMKNRSKCMGFRTSCPLLQHRSSTQTWMRPRARTCILRFWIRKKDISTWTMGELLPMPSMVWHRRRRYVPSVALRTILPHGSPQPIRFTTITPQRMPLVRLVSRGMMQHALCPGNVHGPVYDIGTNSTSDLPRTEAPPPDVVYDIPNNHTRSRGGARHTETMRREVAGMSLPGAAELQYDNLEDLREDGFVSVDSVMLRKNSLC
eukprot:m.1140515 g.1140515  ORF g.1140515 m.1140515 type:complete len:301 (+) comp24446_c0_seq9:246-1148(+)